MKYRISRLSVHQNAKVVAVVMMVGSLMWLVPMMFLFSFQGFFNEDGGAGSAVAIQMLLIGPLFYLIVGYLMFAAACWVYNRLVPYIGGLEYERSEMGGE